MTKVIIGIHGLANKPPQQTLTTWWKNAIEEGLHVNCGIEHPQINFDLCYWAKFLYRYRTHRLRKFNFDDLYNQEPYYKAKPGDLKAYKDGWADSARAKISSVLGSALDVVRDPQFGKITDVLLRKKLKDLQFYWSEDRPLADSDGKMRPAKDVLQSCLIESLKSYAKPGVKIMIIAHSMGSIIGYDVLRKLGRERDNQVDIDHFVTIGSPLGLPLVKSQIETVSWDQKVRTPTIVSGRWVNFSDKLDPVAIDTHLRDDYAANGKGIQVEDDLVVNDYKSKEAGKANHHKSYGYLRTPELSRLIADFLG